MNAKSVVAALLFAVALTMPAFAGEDEPADCANCPPPVKYDSQEVVKTTHDVDHSQVINTTTVVPMPPKVRTHNHLVIHENETRNVGVILHKNTIIEKEIRYRRPRVAAAQTYAVLNPETGEPMWLLYPTSNGYRSVPAAQFHQPHYGFGRSDCRCHWWER
jgi:hypothetical protein